MLSVVADPVAGLIVPYQVINLAKMTTFGRVTGVQKQKCLSLIDFYLDGYEGFEVAIK